jgi:DNA-binding transcriptional ArsR family regulator
MPVLRDSLARETSEIEVGLDQAQALFVDLTLLTKIETYEGLHPWVARTAAEMGDELRQRNLVVLNGLFYALIPKKRYSDFPAYVDDLASEPAELWIERLFAEYEAIECKQPVEASHQRSELLADPELYLTFLRQRFPAEAIYEEVERQVHRWLSHPQEMQAAVIEHMRTMWQTYLRAAWERSMPMLDESVKAFRETRWPGLDRPALAEWITGHEFDDWKLDMLAAARQVRFVPSAHVGPYVTLLPASGTLWIIFGARVPAGARARSAALSRSELLVRLNALADDSRLQILGLCAEQGEMCAQDLIEAIQLSQSSASRHLRQLVATGYLIERRQESAKCYRLNPVQLEATLTALRAYVSRPLTIPSLPAVSEPVAAPL